MTERTPTVDAYVTAMERRIAPLRRPEPRDPAERRRQAAELDVAQSRLLGIAPIDVATEEHVLPVAGGHPSVRIRVYWPTAERPAPGETTGLPILVYCYGGGFTLAGIDWVGWDAGFRRRAHESGIIVIAVDYSHAPEVKFPAQPEQCWTALEWAVAHAGEIGGDPARVALGGASSGGNLAAATALMNRDRANHRLRLVLLEAPALDLTMGHVDAKGLDSNVPGFILRRVGRMLVRQYLGKRKSAQQNPYASPMLAKTLEGFPRTVIYTAELDPLRGDGEAFARRLVADGVPATAVRIIGQTHESGGLTGYVPAADHMHRDVIATLRALHDEPVEYADPRARA
ncbi:alpha/beta hydrolase [Microbacterium sp. ASV49]|uniref:Alpha/beta hydrolase n=1 Tax=Microbacterium candidum TaxID=3041922 RepID=A0ABT7MVG3_9MICO|nr:alpha/beta hydrolase [Microbacterium sp. ASV49]MDL9978436.1 alpha/beta hydrolase [Microbacterium sp. ASV49]